MSWNLPSGEAFLPRVSTAEVKKLAAKTKRASVRTRFLVALHRKQNKSIDEIAEAVQLHRRAVHDILHRFMERGLSAAEPLPKSGRPRRLNARQLRDLQVRLLRSPQASGFNESFWTTRSVLALVKREYGASYTPQWMWTLLCQLGFSVKKPRQTHYKSSPRVCEAFKKKRVEKPREQNASVAPRFVWMKRVSSSRRTRRAVGFRAVKRRS